MRMIDADALLAEYDRVHEGPPGKARTLIENAPTIEPERKMGKWITYTKGSVVTAYKCSECGRTVRDDTGYDVAKDYPFCHCGADMRGE